MKYIKFGTYSGQENMQIDSDLLDEAIYKKSDEITFRLYAWSPKCISLGRNQKDNFLKEGNIDIVRRLTGGRALLHDNEITYSCIMKAPEGVNVNDSYKSISGILINFFKTLDIGLDFGENKKFSTKYDYCMLISTGADVCYKGKKIIGSAQFRKQGYLLQHGSILFDYDKQFLEKIFGEKVEGITSVKEIFPEMTRENFVQKLEDYIITL